MGNAALGRKAIAAAARHFIKSRGGRVSAIAESMLTHYETTGDRRFINDRDINDTPELFEFFTRQKLEKDPTYGVKPDPSELDENKYNWDLANIARGPRARGGARDFDESDVEFAKKGKGELLWDSTKDVVGQEMEVLRTPLTAVEGVADVGKNIGRAVTGQETHLGDDLATTFKPLVWNDGGQSAEAREERDRSDWVDYRKTAPKTMAVWDRAARGTGNLRDLLPQKVTDVLNADFGAEFERDHPIVQRIADSVFQLARYAAGDIEPTMQGMGGGDAGRGLAQTLNPGDVLSMPGVKPAFDALSRMKGPRAAYESIAKIVKLAREGEGAAHVVAGGARAKVGEQGFKELRDALEKGQLTDEGFNAAMEQRFGFGGKGFLKRRAAGQTPRITEEVLSRSLDKAERNGRVSPGRAAEIRRRMGWEAGDGLDRVEVIPTGADAPEFDLGPQLEREEMLRRQEPADRSDFEGAAAERRAEDLQGLTRDERSGLDQPRARVDKRSRGFRAAQEEMGEGVEARRSWRREQAIALREGLSPRARMERASGMRGQDVPELWSAKGKDTAGAGPLVDRTIAEPARTVEKSEEEIRQGFRKADASLSAAKGMGVERRWVPGWRREVGAPVDPRVVAEAGGRAPARGGLRLAAASAEEATEGWARSLRKMRDLEARGASREAIVDVYREVESWRVAAEVAERREGAGGEGVRSALARREKWRVLLDRRLAAGKMTKAAKAAHGKAMASADIARKQYEELKRIGRAESEGELRRILADASGGKKEREVRESIRKVLDEKGLAWWKKYMPEAVKRQHKKLVDMRRLAERHRGGWRPDPDVQEVMTLEKLDRERRVDQRMDERARKTASGRELGRTRHGITREDKRGEVSGKLPGYDGPGADIEKPIGELEMRDRAAEQELAFAEEGGAAARARNPRLGQGARQGLDWAAKAEAEGEEAYQAVVEAHGRERKAAEQGANPEELKLRKMVKQRAVVALVENLGGIEEVRRIADELRGEAEALVEKSRGRSKVKMSEAMASVIGGPLKKPARIYEWLASEYQKGATWEKGMWVDEAGAAAPMKGRRAEEAARAREWDERAHEGEKSPINPRERTGEDFVGPHPEDTDMLAARKLAEQQIYDNADFDRMVRRMKDIGEMAPEVRGVLAEMKKALMSGEGVKARGVQRALRALRKVKGADYAKRVETAMAEWFTAKKIHGDAPPGFREAAPEEPLPARQVPRGRKGRERLAEVGEYEEALRAWAQEEVLSRRHPIRRRSSTKATGGKGSRRRSAR